MFNSKSLGILKLETKFKLREFFVYALGFSCRLWTESVKVGEKRLCHEEAAPSQWMRNQLGTQTCLILIPAVPSTC